MQKNYSKENEWLGCFPSCRFLKLTDLDLQLIPGYLALVPYFEKRGVSNKRDMEIFIYQDLFHIAHALTLLFELDPSIIVQKIMGKYFFLIEDYNFQMDHVGRELFGSIFFYLPLLNQMAKTLRLTYLRDQIFSSTQVIKILQKQDPDLQGVTVARIYFQNIDDGKIRSLELFQASSQNEKLPQKIDATKERLSLLTEFKSPSLLTPIDHLSLELNRLEDVEYIHDLIHNLSSETCLPYQEKISYNPADGSLQTKVLLRDSEWENPKKIIEFVYYGIKNEDTFN